jgi:hypothetical protein
MDWFDFEESEYRDIMDIFIEFKIISKYLKHGRSLKVSDSGAIYYVKLFFWTLSIV